MVQISKRQMRSRVNMAADDDFVRAIPLAFRHDPRVEQIKKLKEKRAKADSHTKEIMRLADEMWNAATAKEEEMENAEKAREEAAKKEAEKFNKRLQVLGLAQYLRVRHQSNVWDGQRGRIWEVYITTESDKRKDLEEFMAALERLRKK